jgi:hypothetical protein
MAHWPKTVRGNLIAVVLSLSAVAFLVQAAIVLSGTVVWALVAALALGAAAFYTWNHRVQAASDLALAGAPSFGDALRNRNRRDANDARELPRL